VEDVTFLYSQVLTPLTVFGAFSSSESSPSPSPSSSPSGFVSVTSGVGGTSDLASPSPEGVLGLRLRCFPLAVVNQIKMSNFVQRAFWNV